VATANRAPRNNGGPFVAAERWLAATTSSSLDLYRDLRDAAVENAFFRTYGTAALASPPEEEAVSEEVIDARAVPAVQHALAHIEEGERTHAIVRIALLLIRRGPEKQRRLSAMKRTRKLVGKDIGLVDMPGDIAREIIRNQSYIVDFEPERALATLPKILTSPEDRRFTLDLLGRLDEKIEANPHQTALLADMRRLLTGDGVVHLGRSKAERRTAQRNRQKSVKRAS
jgi:hypothetical protein